MSIKKVTFGLITGIFLFAGISAQAQVLPKFGVKAGLNYSTVNNADDVEYKAGFIGGVYANINIPSSPVSVQPELLYAQYGANLENADASINADYIQIPVLLKFGFGAAGVKPNVFFGPYIGFNINSEVSSDDGSINVDDEVENTDLGIAVGAGVDIRKFTVGLRYTAGLKNVAIESINEDAKNGAFALTVGINF